jgi:ribosomal-protein-alanine N-acetyltransferase
MTVREARSDDLSRLAAIRAASLSEAPPSLLDVAVRGVGLVLVARAPPSPEPVGYALATCDEERRAASLLELAVAPGHRRQGHGTALLSAVSERLADHERLRLTTRATDDRARAFYEAAGFEPLRELPDHYEDDDGVLYDRRL